MKSLRIVNGNTLNKIRTPERRNNWEAIDIAKIIRQLRKYGNSSILRARVSNVHMHVVIHVFENRYFGIDLIKI